jgi:hypothetical protein
MVTLSRDYFIQKVDKSLDHFHEVVAFVSNARRLKLTPSVIDSVEEEETKAWSSYRRAVINLERFDLGRLVKVEGLGYISNYSKS